MRCLAPGCRTALVFLSMLLGAPAAASAQLIPVKTVPIAAGDQFAIFPSRNQGMAGVSIALDDGLLDPFVNPAKGARVPETRIFAAPSLYDVSDDLGLGRSLPLGAQIRARDWFGGLMLSLQELEGPQPAFFPFIDPFPGTAGRTEVLSESSHGNIYTFATLGRELSGPSLALGGSVFWADLEALEGVELLFPFAPRLDQSGDVLDLRLGVAGEIEGGRTWEALLLHNRLDMTYEFDRVAVSPGGFGEIVRVAELDRTNTWGLHLGYVAPLEAEGWRVGGILTGNYKNHPKIPNYDLMRIPRDPGDSWAFDLGVGVSRTLDRTRLGIDLVLEPIWSETWAEAAEPVPTVGGAVIPTGGKTVDNDFRFTNLLMRMGVGYEAEEVQLEMGLQVRSIDYTLEQTDLVQETRREQDESWTEWTPTWGIGLKLGGLDLHYAGRVTTGTGQPGVLSRFEPLAGGDFTTASADYLVAPMDRLTLQEAHVFAHQVYVVIPVRG